MKHSCLPLGGTAAAREPLAQGHAPPLRQPTSTCTFEKMGLRGTLGHAACGWGLPGKSAGPGSQDPRLFQFFLGSLPGAVVSLSPHFRFPPFLHLQNKELG